MITLLSIYIDKLKKPIYSGIPYLGKGTKVFELEHNNHKRKKNKQKIE